MASHSEHSKESAWKRDGIYVRLTPKRRAALLSLFPDDHSISSPTKAMDKAIEWIAQRNPKEAAATLDRLHVLEDSLKDLSHKQEQHYESMKGSLTSLFEMISAAVSGTDGFDDPKSLKDWLNEEVHTQKLSVSKFLLIRLTWSGTRRSNMGVVDLSFDAEIQGCDGQTTKHAALPHPVQVAGINDSDPISNSDSRKPLFGVCQPLANQGWQVTFYVAQANDTVGEKMGVLRF